MTDEEKKTGNRLCQKYMGWKLESRISGITDEKIYQFNRYDDAGEIIDEHWGGDSWSWKEGDTLPYDSDLNYLTSVVEKIETGNYGFKMCRKVVEVYFDDTKEVILKTKESCRKDSLFKAVVEFIKWEKQNVI